MPERKNSPKATDDELTIIDDFANLSEEEAEATRKKMEERAERIRRRLTMNQAFVPPVTPPDSDNGNS